MEAIDKIIGYEGIKKELKKFADIMRNPEKYETLGAKLPHGIMFYGEPGVGKTCILMDLLEELENQEGYFPMFLQLREFDENDRKTLEQEFVDHVARMAEFQRVVLLIHYATLLYQVSINVNLSDVVYDNGKSYTSFIIKDTVE